MLATVFRSPDIGHPCREPALAGRSGISLPPLGGGTADLPPEPSVAGGPVLPSRYRSEEIVGRWGYTSYQKEGDRARTVVAAGRLCRQPYVIARGPTGGVMMHLADQRQPTELRLKGGPGERNYIGPDGEPGGSPQDREIVSLTAACWLRVTSIPTRQPLRQHGLRALCPPRVRASDGHHLA